MVIFGRDLGLSNGAPVDAERGRNEEGRGGFEGREG